MKKFYICSLAVGVLLTSVLLALGADGLKPGAPFDVPLVVDGKDVSGKAVVAGDALRVTAPKDIRYTLVPQDVPTPPLPAEPAKYVIVVGEHRNRTPAQAELLRNSALREIVGKGNFWLYDVSETGEIPKSWVDLATANAKAKGQDPASTPWWIFTDANFKPTYSEAVPEGFAAVQARLLAMLPDSRGPPKGTLLGCLPRTTKLGAGKFPLMGNEWLIDKAKWKATSLRPLVPAILDQNGTNECCPHMGVAAVHLIRSIDGAPYVELSPASVYRFGNGGRDQGMTLEDCLSVLSERGALPVSLYPSRNWRAPYPLNGAKVAAGYKAVEWEDCPSTAHIGSAVQRGWPVSIGVFWSGGGGHAILVTGWRPEAPNWEIQNSWGAWGDEGFGHLPESQVAKGINTFGAWALRLTSRPDTDPQPKPPAKVGNGNSRFDRLKPARRSSCPSGTCPLNTAP